MKRVLILTTSGGGRSVAARLKAGEKPGAILKSMKNPGARAAAAVAMRNRGIRVPKG